MRRISMRMLGWLLVFLIVCPITLTVWAGCSPEDPTPEEKVAVDPPAPSEKATPETSAPQASVPNAVKPEPTAKVAVASSKPKAQTTRVFWGKNEYDLPWITHGKNHLYCIDDETIQNLCTHVGCRLSHTYVGQTVMASSNGRQVIVTNGEKTMRVNGNEKPLLGKLVVKDDSYYIDGKLLFFMLGMKPYATDKGFILRQTLSAPKYVDEGLGRRVVFSAAGTLAWTCQDLDDGSTEYSLANTVWTGEKSTYDFEDLHIELKNANDGSLKVKMSCMDSWVFAPRKGLRASELVVGLLPTYPRPSEPASLEEMQVLDDDIDSTTLVLKANGGYWYHWLFDATTRTLRLELAGTGSSIDGNVDVDVTGLKNVRVGFFGDNEMDITRLTATVKSGYRVDIEAAQDEVGKLLVRIEPGQYDQSLYDEGFTKGYQYARGLIVLDPGHGGGDSGCRNKTLALNEKDITLDVAFRLRELLETNGWAVRMTREDDSDVSWLHSPDKVELQARCDVANDNDAMWFISLHCNASVNSSVNGSSVYWYKRADKKLAEGLLSALGANLGINDWGLLRDGFYVLRHTAMPAALIEMAYLSNNSDGRKLGDPAFRQRIAQNIAEAIENMINE